MTQPEFNVSDSCVEIVLPLLKTDINLNTCEEIIYDIIHKYESATSQQLLKLTGFSKSKVVRLINQLNGKHLIKTKGQGRATTYVLFN